MENKSGTERRGRSLQIIFSLVGIILAALFFLNGCAPKGTVPQQPKEFTETEAHNIYGNGPAKGLINKANRLLKEGKNGQAEIVMERAQRIEPSNPFIWYSMGKIKYRRGQCSQAIQFLLKSKSLSAGDRNFSTLNDRLLTQAEACR